jgi:membrane-associated phospholipid phosphatase
VATAPVTPLAAQRAASTAQAPDTVAPFFTRADAWLAGAFVLGTIALAQADQRLAHTLQDPDLQDSHLVKDGASFFRFMGQPAPEIIGLGLYVGGRLAHDRPIAALGLHGLEAVALTQALTFSIKGVAGRSRPFVHSDTTPNDFSFLRGIKEGGDFSSFPSGHTSNAFAVAAVTTGELAQWSHKKGWSPTWTYVAAGTLFGGATLVGLSRMYNDKHWASDVIGGAAIGTFSGFKVVKYAYRHPTNRVDRWLLPMTVQRAQDGSVMVGLTIPMTGP